MKSEKESPKSEKYPTTVRFDEDDLPELTKWKVGGKYKLTMEVEQTSMSKGDEYGVNAPKGTKSMMSASFKVISVTPLGGGVKTNRPTILSDALKKRV